METQTRKQYVIRDSKEIAVSMAKHYLKELDLLLKKNGWTDEEEVKFHEIKKVMVEAKRLVDSK